jgi:hypothetical protein
MPPDPIAIIETVPGVGPLAIPWLPVPTRARSVYGVFYTVLNYLAQNYRNAQNAKVPEDVPKPAS